MNGIRTSIRFTDAYSGRETPVFMRIRPEGPPMLFAPFATTPRVFYESVDAALRALGPALTCPYTGEGLRPVRDGSAVMFMGGWDPRRPQPRSAFLHCARMRNGVSDRPPETGRVEVVQEDPPMARSREKPPTQEALDAVKEITEPKRTRTRRRR